MICKHILLTFLNDHKFIFFAHKQFQVFLFTTNHLPAHSQMVLNISI